jgi:tRNA dimethylallyltransferase
MMRLSETQVAMRPLLVVVGPTAVGKSEIALALAQALGTEILTADSRQVFRGLNVGTDKPPVESRGGVPHRMIDLVEPDQPFNAGAFRRHALAEIERLYGERKLPLVVGGTGLYVRALVRGLCDVPETDLSTRARLIEQARRQGRAFMYRELQRVDPATARHIHPNDEPKILRALEIYQRSGKRLSEVQDHHRFGDDTFTSLIVGLTRERAALYRRIERRVEQLFARGLVEETQRLLAQGYQRGTAAMKGLGYRQVAGFLAGEYGLEEAVRLLKRDTRRFAKRQMTWFRKEPNVEWMSVEEHESVATIAERIARRAEEFLANLLESRLAQVVVEGR